MKPADKYILAALCTGLLFGAALGRFSARWFPPHEWLMGGRNPARRLDRFSTRFGLSPEQKEQVRVIFQARHDKLNALFSELGPKVEEVRSSTSADVRKVLTPEQQAKFDQFHAKHEAEWKKSPLYRLIYDRPPPEHSS